MLRTAQLSFLICLTTLTTGCGVFGLGKKPASAGGQNAHVDTYVPPPYESTLPTLDTNRVDSPALTPPAAEPMYLASSAPSSGSRYHTVAKKDTLYGLARTYYNDPSKWRDIYNANRATLSDPNRIRVGQRLLIP